MTRSSALLLAAVVLMAVCGQHTALAAATVDREQPIFVTVVGTVGEFSNYTRLQAFCGAMTTVSGIMGCQIFSVKPSATVANSVQIGAYFYTAATITTADAAIAAIVNAFPLNTNVGGIIRSGQNTDITAATKGTTAPAKFAYLYMHIRFYFRGTQTGTSTALTPANLLAKIESMDMVIPAPATPSTAQVLNLATTATFESNNIYVTSVRVYGYWTNRNTMYNDILTKLRDSSGLGAFILIHTEDVTRATADTDIMGYDAQAPTTPNTNFPYRYVITLTTNAATGVVTAATAAAPANAVQRGLTNFLYPNVEAVAQLTATNVAAEGSGSRVDITVDVRSSDHLLRILQMLNDEIYSGNTTRATFGTIQFTGILRHVADNTYNAFRIPTTDFPLQQRYTLPVESLQRLYNQSAAVNELCAQLVRRTANVTACYIERIAASAPTDRFVAKKFTTLAVDSALALVLNATDASAAVRMRRNLLLTLQSAAPVLGLNFTDATTTVVVVREEAWEPRDQKHAMFTDFFFPSSSATAGAATDFGQLVNLDSVQERIRLFTVAANLFSTDPYASTDMTFHMSRTDVNVTTTPANGLNLRAWVIAPRVITPLGLYLRQLFLFSTTAFTAKYPVSVGTPAGVPASLRNGLNGTGEAFSVTTGVTLTQTDPAAPTGGLLYTDATTSGNAALQDNFESSAAAAFTGEAALVFDAAAVTGAAATYVAPIRIFTLTAASMVTIVAQHATVLNFTTGSTFANFPLRTPGLTTAVLAPELDHRAFPAVAATPTTVTPATAPNAPATAPAAPVAPSVFAPGAVNGVQVGVDFFIIIPPVVDPVALCNAILAEGQGAPYNIRTCQVRINETASSLPAGTKFAQQVTYQRVVVVLTTADPTSANSLINNIINGVNNKSFLRRFNIADVNLVPLPASVPTGTNQPQPAVAPTVPPATNGTFTTVDIYIVILGTALDSAGQAALNNECGSLLGGGATCVTKNIEQTTAARKMTTQASALRLTETVRAPASTYPSANAIVARLQAAVRSNNNRLGGQQVVSIATIGNGSSAAARTAPAFLALLAATLAVVLSAVANC